MKTTTTTTTTLPGAPALLFGQYAGHKLEVLQAGRNGTHRTYAPYIFKALSYQPCLPLPGNQRSEPPAVGMGLRCKALGCSGELHQQLGFVPIDVVSHDDFERYVVTVRLGARRKAMNKERKRRHEEAVSYGDNVALEDVLVTDDDLEPKVGNSAQESAVRALRWVFSRAAEDGHVHVNPASGLAIPRRVRTKRRAMSISEREEFCDTAIRCHHDPKLIHLLLRFHFLAGARLNEALLLTFHDVDVERSTVWIGEKSGERREQPVPLELIIDLLEFAISRGATSTDPRLFRSKKGRPFTRRVYENLYAKVKAELPWAARMGLATHRLRKTSSRIVERDFRVATGEAFLGHTMEPLKDSYFAASINEVATAVRDLTGHDHPLAQGPPRAVTGSLLPDALLANSHLRPPRVHTPG